MASTLNLRVHSSFKEFVGEADLVKSREFLQPPPFQGELLGLLLNHQHLYETKHSDQDPPLQRLALAYCETGRTGMEALQQMALWTPGH